MCFRALPRSNTFFQKGPLWTRITPVIAKEIRLCRMPPCLWGNQEGGLQGSDIQGLSAPLLEAARRRNLSANSLAALRAVRSREVFLSLLLSKGKPNSRVTSRHLSKGFSAFACRLTPLLDAGRSKGRELAIASDPRSSGGLQRRQIHLAVLARNRDLSAAAARVLLNAGDAMITGVRQLDGCASSVFTADGFHCLMRERVTL